MLPDRVSNPGPLTYESGALPIALRGPAFVCEEPVWNEGVTISIMLIYIYIHIYIYIYIYI